MTEAPLTPTTGELHRRYPISQETQAAVAVSRHEVGSILIGKQLGLLVVKGSCALTSDSATIRREGQDHYDMSQTEDGLYVVHRMPPWKPRTNPEDWHGEETTNPLNAFSTLAREAMYGSGVAIELRYPYHIERYGPLLTLGWIGSRAINETEDMTTIAMMDRSLPLSVKNGLDGAIEPALARVQELSELRGPGAAPVVLLYRGGENAQDPASWERQYRQALEITGGKMMVDVAHGTEMAHHPDGNFRKSIEAQMLGLEHVIRIAEKGELPNAVMMEASDVITTTDPHMPHSYAMGRIQYLNNLRRSMLSTGA